MRYTGIPWFIREFYARHRVTIIYYHNPEREVFKKHMDYFARHYNFVDIEQVVSALQQKSLASLPVKSLLVTIDDGHSGNAGLFDVIEAHKIPAVIYLTAGLIDTNYNYWFNVVTDQSRREALKKLNDSERRATLSKEFGHQDKLNYGRAFALSANQVREFLSVGGTIGSHTVFHPILPRCDNEVGELECIESKAILERMFNVPVHHFALPNGDYDERTLGWLRKAGYKSCRTIQSGFVDSQTDLMRLPGFHISETDDLNEVIIQACGVWWVPMLLLRKF